MSLNMNDLEMLTAREQLMEDIECIIESHFAGRTFPTKFFRLQLYKPAQGTDLVYITDELIRDASTTLCDAVCKNFPAQVNLSVGKK